MVVQLQAAPSEPPPIPLLNGARVSRKVIANAKAGEFINLTDFIPANEPSNVMESVIDEHTGNLIFKQKSIKKSIDSFYTWSLAWTGYEEIILENNFALYRNCVSY